MSIAAYLAWTRTGRRYPRRQPPAPAVKVPSTLEVQPPADIPAAAPYKAPVFPPPAPERYFRCRPCDVEWRGTDPACWCCGRNVLAS